MGQFTHSNWPKKTICVERPGQTVGTARQWRDFAPERRHKARTCRLESPMSRERQPRASIHTKKRHPSLLLAALATTFSRPKPAKGEAPSRGQRLGFWDNGRFGPVELFRHFLILAGLILGEIRPC